jgi:hypothetical protein
MDSASPAAVKTAAADPIAMYLEGVSTVSIGSVYARVE